MKTNLDVSQNIRFAPEESINDRESVFKQNKSLSEIQNLQKSQSVIEETKNNKQPEIQNYVVEKRTEQPKIKHERHSSENKIIKKNLAEDNDGGRWNTLIQRDPDFDEYNDIVNEHSEKLGNMPISLDYKNNVVKNLKNSPLNIKQGELIDPRSGSPIVPALRNKLIQQSQTVHLNNTDGDHIDNNFPKRSITEIGQEAKDNHERNKSVTDLGKEDQPEAQINQSAQDHSRYPSITQEKDIGKPPLSQNSVLKDNKLSESIEAKFYESK